MALQGNLRDFSATEILQLLGSQRKSGCLTLEHDGVRGTVWIEDGRIVSARTLGAAKDDRLLAFLAATHRLSAVQVAGVLGIQQESGRDLEDLLVDGRYTTAEELAGFVERQVLDDLMRWVAWSAGDYRFDPETRWPHKVLATIGMEAALMEAARRNDERGRCDAMFAAGGAVPSVLDLPGPREALTDEERELFGLVDGQLTVAEVVARSPLSDHEGREALLRFVEAGWIGLEGAPQAAARNAAPRLTVIRGAERKPWARELAIAAGVVALIAGLRIVTARTAFLEPRPPAADVYADAGARDLRFALELYARENGHYPATLAPLVEDRWVAREATHPAGYMVFYRPEAGGQSYQLRFTPDR